MFGGPVHRCPRDKKNLEFGHFHEVEIHRCPECQGVLVDQKKLHGLLEEMSRELLKTISIDCPLDEIEDKGRIFHCPRCSSETENYGFMGSKKVVIDCCKKCSAIWLDTDELGAMSLMHARTQKRLETAELESKKREIESEGVLSRHLALRKATNRGLLLGFILGKLT